MQPLSGDRLQAQRRDLLVLDDQRSGRRHQPCLYQMGGRREGEGGCSASRRLPALTTQATQMCSRVPSYGVMSVS